jgi:FAD:protein FMN transferase
VEDSRRATGSPSARPVHRPAGLLTATALAPTALEAETLAKTALLRGAYDARSVLERHGGLLVHEDGRVEAIGALFEVAR